MRTAKYFLIAGLIIMLVGCMFGGFITADDKVEKTFSASSAPTVVIETFNGHITVQGNAGESVEVEITRRGSGMTDQEARADLDNVLVETRQDGNTIYIKIYRSDNRSGNSGASVQVRLPKGASMELATSNGNISVEDVQGNARLSSSNGNLTLTKGGGTLDLSTSNGRIEIEADNAIVSARTSNGHINFSGSLAEGTNTFNSSNAHIELSLPADSTFSINANTSNARIASDFTVSGGSQGDTYLNGSVGNNPQTQITATTSNGNITINKR